MNEMGVAAFLKIAHPIVARVLCAEPLLSHLILDAEHGAFSDSDLELLCGLIRFAGKESIVRVAGPDPQVIGRALDRGAQGVMIPRVASVSEVEEAIRGLVLSPSGARGWDPTCAGFHYGAGGEAAVAPRCYVQIETKGALDHAARISAVPAVTDLFVGPADLSRALGTEGEIFSVKVREAIQWLSERVKGQKVRLGLFVDSPERTRWAFDRGYRFFAVTSDVLLLMQGARAVTKSLSDLGSRLETPDDASA